jgi:preprotein translocase subunit YajC
MRSLFAVVFATMLCVEPAFAQTADGAGVPDIGSGFGMFPLVLIFALAYFLLLRPQMKQQRAHEDAISAVKRNDKVVLASGIEGVITKVDDANKRLTVKIADGVEVKVIHEGASIRSIVDRKPANDDGSKNSPAAKKAVKKASKTAESKDEAKSTSAKKPAAKKPAAKKTSTKK